jgi:hypothetical protein
MKFKLTYSSNITCSEKILYNSEKVDVFFEKLISTIDNNLLDSWTIYINIIYDSNLSDINRISVGKRGVIYSTDKEKWISIGIPFPTNDIVKWGIHRKYSQEKPPLQEKYYDFITVDFNEFDNITDYTEYAILRGLQTLFKIGISLKGYKITSFQEYAK